jgi:hypothetical protein
LKGRATRHKRLVEELLRINRTEGHVRDILIRALADALPRLANSMEKTVVECAEEFSPPVIVVCGQRQRST